MLRILFRKELTLELRRKSVISGLILYLVSVSFICYVSLGLQNTLSPLVWSSLFWITMLFTAVNTVAKSFISEKKGIDIYSYFIASPEAIILSKILYNFLVLLFLSSLCFALFSLFLSNPILDLLVFGFLLLLMSLGFSVTLTLLSSISSKAGNSNILMAVLSFPIVISMLVLAIKVTKNCIDGLDRSASLDELVTLAAINCLLGALSFLLFPYIWRS